MFTIYNEKDIYSMKLKLTIDKKQKIYDHILTLDCPDLLAALMADRTEKKDSTRIKILSELLSYSFLWDNTEEGFEFWEIIYQEIIRREYARELEISNDFAELIKSLSLLAAAETSGATLVPEETVVNPEPEPKNPESLFSRIWKRIKSFLTS